MLDHSFSGPYEASSRGASQPVSLVSGARAVALPLREVSPLVERQDGAWRVLPIEGRFELVYEDGNGAWSVRQLAAHELKIGPGRVLLGGTDRNRGGYRGFRADRIHRLVDRDTGERIERNILDWLTRRAEATRRDRVAALRVAARRSRAGRSRDRSHRGPAAARSDGLV